MNRSLVIRCLSLLLALWLPVSGFATALQMVERSPPDGPAHSAHAGHCLQHAGHGHAGDVHDHSGAGAAFADTDTGADAAAASHCTGSDEERLSHGQCTFCQVSVSLVNFEPLVVRDTLSSHVLIPRRAVLRLSADTEPPLRPPSALAP